MTSTRAFIDGDRVVYVGPDGQWRHPGRIESIIGDAATVAFDHPVGSKGYMKSLVDLSELRLERIKAGTQPRTPPDPPTGSTGPPTTSVTRPCKHCGQAIDVTEAEGKRLRIGQIMHKHRTTCPKAPKRRSPKGKAETKPAEAPVSSPAAAFESITVTAADLAQLGDVDYWKVWHALGVLMKNRIKATEKGA